MAYPFEQAYHDLGVARGPRLAMCWHMAEGGGTVGFLSRANKNAVSVHFVVEYSGRVVQMLKLTHMHSSIRTSDIRLTTDTWPEPIPYGRATAKDVLGDWADIAHGTLGPNHATIAVEVEGFASKGPNAAQTTAIVALGADLGLPAHLGHRDFADYKACPGRLFPWEGLGGHGFVKQEEPDVPGLQFRFVDRVAGIATVKGTNHALIRVDTGEHVGAPAGQEREVAGKIVLTAPAPGSSPFPAGTMGYLVGNVPGLKPDTSVAAMLLESDVTFQPSPVDCGPAIAADRAKAKIVYQ